VTRSGRVRHLNCFDKILQSFEPGCTGRRMTYTGMLYLKGEPDADRLREAVLATARAHPELMTTLCGGPLWHHREVHEEVLGEVLEVQDLATVQAQGDSGRLDVEALHRQRLLQWINRPLDVRKSFPFRVLLLRKRPGECTLAFTFHHSAVDGVRAVHLGNDIISRYHNKPPGEALVSRGLEPDGDELLREARIERTKTEHFYREMLCHLAWFVFINPLFHPVRIFHDKAGRPEEVSFCSTKITPEEFQQLKAKANSVGSTVNDILMAGCFRSVEQWNKRHGKRSRKVSLLIPIDVGTPDLNGIISNQISYISFHTSVKERADSTTLLKILGAKRARMLKQRRGNAYSIIYFASILRLMPLAFMEVFAKLVLFPLYADSVICTNPGFVRINDCGEDPIEGGNFRVMGFDAVPFVQTSMGMNICVATSADGFGIYIAYDTGYFSKEKAEEFLALCRSELLNYQVSPGQT
jgi:NRPS condensation-like uncharacterized protein